MEIEQNRNHVDYTASNTEPVLIEKVQTSSEHQSCDFLLWAKNIEPESLRETSLLKQRVQQGPNLLW